MWWDPASAWQQHGPMGDSLLALTVRSAPRRPACVVWRRCGAYVCAARASKHVLRFEILESTLRFESREARGAFIHGGFTHVIHQTFSQGDLAPI